MKTPTKTDKFKKEQEDTFEQIVKTEIPDSPFVVISTDGKHFGTLGKYRLTEVYKTKEKAIEELEKVNWNRIMQVISLVVEILHKEDEVKV